MGRSGTLPEQRRSRPLALRHGVSPQGLGRHSALPVWLGETKRAMINTTFLQLCSYPVCVRRVSRARESYLLTNHERTSAHQSIWRCLRAQLSNLHSQISPPGLLARLFRISLELCMSSRFGNLEALGALVDMPSIVLRFLPAVTTDESERRRTSTIFPLGPPATVGYDFASTRC